MIGLRGMVRIRLLGSVLSIVLKLDRATIIACKVVVKHFEINLQKLRASIFPPQQLLRL